MEVVYILKYIPAFLSLIGFIGLLLLGFRIARFWKKQVVFSLAAVFMAIFLFSLLNLRKQHKNRRITHLDGNRISTYSIPDSILGYRAMEGPADIQVKKWRKNEVIYDSRITLEGGWRKVNNSNSYSKDVVLFLGGSFCFGEGLDDEETLAHQFAVSSDRQYQVYNLGFHGYGPHHALRTLEKNLIPFEMDSAGSMVSFYRMIPDHIRRAAGYSSWDRNGPYYEVESEVLVDKGQFNPYVDPTKLSIPAKVWNLMKEQLGVNRWSNKNRNTPASKRDVIRAVMILNEIKKIHDEKEGQFLLLLEPEFKEFDLYDDMTGMLDSLDIPYFNIDDFSFYDKSNKKTWYIPGDGHPSALYNEQLSIALDSLLNDYICDRI